MAFKLKDLTLPEAKLTDRLVWVNFKGCEFQIRYVSKATLMAIAESCKVAIFDPKKGGRSITLEPDKFIAGLANAIVKGWNKVTPRTLTSLYPLDLTSLTDADKDAPIEFTQENLLEVLTRANSLDDFLQECATEAGLFRAEAEKSLEKLIDFAEYHLNPVNDTCEACHEMYVIRAGRETPCRTCPKPLLDYRNEWLWEVFQSLATQSRMGGMGGFVGFDYTALPFILNAKGIPESLWSYFLDKLEMISPICSRYWNKRED